MNNIVIKKAYVYNPHHTQVLNDNEKKIVDVVIELYKEELILENTIDIIKSLEIINNLIIKKVIVPLEIEDVELIEEIEEVVEQIEEIEEVVEQIEEIFEEKITDIEEEIIEDIIIVTNDEKEDILLKYKNREFFVTGKLMGEEISKSILFKKHVYTVFCSHKEVELSQKDYTVMNTIAELNRYEHVLNKLIKDKIIKTEIELIESIEFLQKEKLIVIIDFEDDSEFMNNTIIKRNAKGLGREDRDKWLLKAYHLNDKEEDIYLSSSEEYRVWMCANGVSNPLALLSRISERMNYQSSDDVKVLLEKHVKNFVRLGIWDVEYKVKDTDINESSVYENEVFKYDNLRADDLLIPVGYEIGALNSDKNKRWISRGNEWINLTEDEYIMWSSLSKKIMKLGQLQFEHNRNSEDIAEEHIKPMLEKKILLLWNSEFLLKSKNIRVISQGKLVPSKVNEKILSGKFKGLVNIGYDIEVYEFSQKLWTLLSGNRAIEDIVNDMVKWSNSEDRNDIEEKVIENIRALMSLGLAKIDVI